jgi:predicted kinase
MRVPGCRWPPPGIHRSLRYPPGPNGNKRPGPWQYGAVSVARLPALVVVSDPMGAGKTTLAHKIARSVGCPAICRDEIKEGMVHAAPGFVAGPGDELTMRTLPVFFSLLELLLREGVTTVAEAAFQDHMWRPGLEPLAALARLRIVHCVVAADVAFQRGLRRGAEDPLRRAHADPGPSDAAAHARFHRAFNRVSVDAPWIEVDTTDGYVPGLGEIVAFAAEDPPSG